MKKLDKMSSRVLPALLAVVFSCCATVPGVAQTTGSLLRPNDRMVFVGDSITGQGGNVPQGWTNLMAEALAQTMPEGAPTLIPLGGSGQTVGSWQNIEKNSREKSIVLDVKSVDVKSTLDQHADVLVVMLGMNDVLAPSIDGSAGDIEKWAGQYRELLSALRARTTPRVVALATVPMCTEDERSPKNRTLAMMAAQLRKLASQENAVVLPVHESMLKVLAHGRIVKPDFHVTTDYVHPNIAGHRAIAAGMLEGLGAKDAAQKLANLEPVIWGVKATQLPGLSYAVEYLPGDINDRIQTCKVRYWWSHGVPGRALDGWKTAVSLTADEGWTVTPAVLDTPSGEFTVSGPFDRWENRLMLQGDVDVFRTRVSIVLPAPWLVGVTRVRQVVWQDSNRTFDPARGQLPADDVVVKGEKWGQPVEVATGKAIEWKRHFATVDYIGGAKSGSVDMSAQTFFESFEMAYGARWIYSDIDREVQFKLSSQSFGGNDYLAIWMNGTPVYSGHFMKEPGKLVSCSLKKGWNAMAVKSNHLQWQWQYNIDLVPGEGTEQLRFAAVGKPN